MLDKRVVVFHGHDRPDVEVRRDDGWHSGELRAWYQADDGWDAMVEYNVGPGMTYLERVTSDRVRPA
jgi:hypothetical protein